jgi:hypothetical protein
MASGKPLREEGQAGEAEQAPIVYVRMRMAADAPLGEALLHQYPEEVQIHDLPSHFTEPEDSEAQVRALAASPPAELRLAQGEVLLRPDLSWPKGTRFFTILRDPLERTFSEYRSLRDGESGSGPSLEDALSQGRIADDLQTRVLAGCAAPVGEIPDGTLELALENLERLTLTGLTERLDESVVLLTHAFSWRRVACRPTDDNAGGEPGEEEDEEISPEARALIEQHNTLDLELHRRARERFESIVAEQGDEFGIEVTALRRANLRLSGLAADAPPEPLSPGIDGSPKASTDVRELLIEAQAELLVREKMRLELVSGSAPRRARLMDSLARTNEQAAKLESELASLKAEASARANLAALEDRVERLRENRRENREEIARLEALLAEERKAYDTKLKPLRERLEQRTAEISRLQAQIEEERKAHGARLKSFREKLEQRDAAINKTREQVKRLEARLAESGPSDREGRGKLARPAARAEGKEGKARGKGAKTDRQIAEQIADAETQAAKAKAR